MEDEEIGPVVLANEDKWEQEVSFVPEKAGESQQVEFLLFKVGDSQPYDSLLLLINVSEKE